MYLNKAILFGRLGQDPELKALPSGTQVCSFSIATNRVYKDKDGNKQEQTDWHNIVLFGRQAELAKQYLKKGDTVMIEGRIQTRSWEAGDGQKRYRTEIVADKMQFGPRGTSSQSPAETPQAQEISGDEAAEPSPADIQYPDEEEINPDDIPF